MSTDHIQLSYNVKAVSGSSEVKQAAVSIKIIGIMHMKIKGVPVTDILLVFIFNIMY